MTPDAKDAELILNSCTENKYNMQLVNKKMEEFQLAIEKNRKDEENKRIAKENKEIRKNAKLDNNKIKNADKKKDEDENEEKEKNEEEEKEKDDSTDSDSDNTDNTDTDSNSDDNDIFADTEFKKIIVPESAKKKQLHNIETPKTLSDSTSKYITRKISQQQVPDFGSDDTDDEEDRRRARLRRQKDEEEQTNRKHFISEKEKNDFINDI